MSDPQPATRAPGKSSIGERELVIMLALSQALHALAIDSMLPGLGEIARDLGIGDPNRRQLVVGAFLLGMALGSLTPGILADRFGRRKVLLGSIAGYVVMTLACALIHDFTWLIGLRFAQGLVSGGLSVMPATVIRDRFEGDRMARLQSMITFVLMAVPMLAPTIGQAILLFAGWRWIFGLIAAQGIAIGLWAYLRLPETLHPEFRQPISLRAVGANLGATLTNRSAISYVLAGACTMGMAWGFIQTSQQLIAEHFGAGKTFPLIFAAMAISLAVSNLINSRIVERFGARRVSHAALLGYIAISATHAWLAFTPYETLWTFTPLVIANLMLAGFIGANFGAIALQPFARTAGAAASLQGFIRMILSSAIGAAVGQSYDQTAQPLTTAFLIAGTAALALVLFAENGRLFRRLNPPGAPRPVG